VSVRGDIASLICLVGALKHAADSSRALSLFVVEAFSDLLDRFAGSRFC